MFIGATKKIYPDAAKEVVVIGKTATKKKTTRKTKAKTPPKKVPAIKVRVSRGKSYDPNFVIKNGDDAVRAFRQYLNRYHIEGQEQLLVMYLSRNNGVIGIYQHSKGGMTSTTLDISMITAAALELQADGVICCHNHPSGAASPSEPDKKMASRLSSALSQFNINLLDNIILTKNGSKHY